MYRIACRYEPSHPRMAGKSKDAQLFTRGAWRVVECYKVTLTSAAEQRVKITSFGISYYPLLSIPCVARKPLRKGTLINPRKEVDKFLTFRRACMRPAANSVIRNQRVAA